MLHALASTSIAFALVPVVQQVPAVRVLGPPVMVDGKSRPIVLAEKMDPSLSSTMDFAHDSRWGDSFTSRGYRDGTSGVAGRKVSSVRNKERTVSIDAKQPRKKATSPSHELRENFTPGSARDKPSPKQPAQTEASPSLRATELREKLPRETGDAPPPPGLIELRENFTPGSARETASQQQPRQTGASPSLRATELRENLPRETGDAPPPPGLIELRENFTPGSARETASQQQPRSQPPQPVRHTTLPAPAATLEMRVARARFLGLGASGASDAMVVERAKALTQPAMDAYLADVIDEDDLKRRKVAAREQAVAELDALGPVDEAYAAFESASAARMEAEQRFAIAMKEEGTAAAEVDKALRAIEYLIE
jgi:hypothetical protein